MRDTFRMTCRVALAAWVTFVGCAALATTPRTIAAASSTWYWQNPLPRAYSIRAISCPSVNECVAVGATGTIVSTDNGGRTWTNRVSGTHTALWSVTCPTRAICYAGGSTGDPFGPSPPVVHNVILKSVDGGTTWRQPATYLPTNPHQILASLACASVTICLTAGSDYVPHQSNPVLRTTDGGRTWRAVRMPGSYQSVSVMCATSTTCYATDYINGGIGPNGTGLLRSADAGKTWSARGLHPPMGINTIACPGANTCVATATNCGECNVGDVFLTTNGARTWKRVAYHVVGSAPAGIACPLPTTCYAAAGESVVRTTNGGKTWSVRRLPDPAPALACPSPATCYMAAIFTVLKTSDGFDHTQETLARSRIHDFSLNDVNCASATACYATGTRNVCPDAGPCNDVAAPLLTTSDGGSTWHVTPTTPDLLARLSCPRPAVCYAIGVSNGESRQAALDRSGDGARTWQRTTWQQMSHRLAPNNQAMDISCVAARTCYVLATVSEARKGNNFVGPLVAVLVTHDAGRTWSVKTGIDAVARAGARTPTVTVAPARISCPSATTCFVLATVYPRRDVVILSTRNGGQSWTRHIPMPGAVPNTAISWLGHELACPTITSCYLLSYRQNPQKGNPNGVPGPVLVTHDAGATWHSSAVRNGPYLFAVACATAQACRVVGPDGIFATNDGGKTWREQLVADGTQARAMTSVACPAVDTCYAVGGLSILATHPRR